MIPWTFHTGRVLECGSLWQEMVLQGFFAQSG